MSHIRTVRTVRTARIRPVAPASEPEKAPPSPEADPGLPEQAPRRDEPADAPRLRRGAADAVEPAGARASPQEAA